MTDAMSRRQQARGARWCSLYTDLTGGVGLFAQLLPDTFTFAFLMRRKPKAHIQELWFGG